MIVRRLDDNHDWTFGNGLANYAQQSEAIAQSVKTALLSFYKDWFLNNEHGVKWFDYFVKNPPISAMEYDIKTTVSRVDGVVKITDFQLQLDTVTRELIVTVRYTDTYSTDNTVTTNVANNG